MTTSDIQLLRLYVDDPQGANERFTSAQLQDFIDRFGDLHSAAAEVWGMKAATVAEWYLTNTDGALLNRGEVFKHCMDMKTYHLSVAGSGGGFVSVLIDTSGDEEASSEF